MHLAHKKVEKKKIKKPARRDKKPQMLEQAQVDPMEVDEHNPQGDEPTDKDIEQDELDEEWDERFVLTHEDQDNFLKEIEGKGELKQIEEVEKDFGEKVNEKLEELQ